MKLQLYTYFRSSAAYRVRIALALKALSWEAIPINLLTGEQRQAGYRQLNPQGLVPALAVDGQLINQSLAIIEYLEEAYPSPSLFAADPLLRAQQRSLAYQIAMDIHPLNNLRVLHYLKKQLTVDEEAKLQWYQHWIGEGFAALEQSLELLPRSGLFCLGENPSLADVCLLPQYVNGQRFNCDMTNYPIISAIAEHCAGLAAFQKAAPEAQSDYVAP